MNTHWLTNSENLLTSNRVTFLVAMSRQDKVLTLFPAQYILRTVTHRHQGSSRPRGDGFTHHLVNYSTLWIWPHLPTTVLLTWLASSKFNTVCNLTMLLPFSSEADLCAYTCYYLFYGRLIINKLSAACDSTTKRPCGICVIALENFMPGLS